ncbi:putative methionine--tRNA ligase [Apostasia shenzhenica]|uniref:Putative methionine--tRNA ligase n=1 Tax=Apostasia shenzhenica TaxID=1088818 RepID=A0A2I0B1G7_9ASPA|nr:putative methionine--tRNA ligase [Apostasia shenzhenica]
MATASAAVKSGVLFLSSSFVSAGRQVPPSSSSNLPPLCSIRKRGLRRLVSLFTPVRSLSSSYLPADYNHSSSAAAVASADEAPCPPPADPVKEAADVLDIRVGRILRAWRHPEADSLYVEEVDVGEAEPRTMCSGLVNYVPLEHLQDIKVVVLANLKPRNMRGIKSNGMLMAASDASHEIVELLIPPEDSVPGERIWFGAEGDKEKQPEAATPNQIQKKKIWESVQPHLKTTDERIAVLGAHPMRTSAGVVTSRSLKNGSIS